VGGDAGVGLLGHAGDPGVGRVGAERATPAGVAVGEDEATDDVGMASIELEDDGHSPGEPDDRTRRHVQRADEAGQAVAVVAQPETVRYVGGTAGARLVPRDDGELVSEGVELWCPGAAVLGAAVDEHHRRAVPGSPEGDAQTVDLDEIHGSKLAQQKRFGLTHRATMATRCSSSCKVTGLPVYVRVSPLVIPRMHREAWILACIKVVGE
jgi:hypothetical protein